MNRKTKQVKRHIILGLIVTVMTATVNGCASEYETVVTKENEPIIITVLAGQSTSDAGIEDMINDKISQKLPDVSLKWECVDWGEDFDKSIRAKFAAGDVPDIMVGKAQDVQSYYGTENLAPLNFEISNIMEDARVAVTVGDTIYGLPYNAWYQGVIYHKGIFEECHLEIPETIEEMETVVETLQKENITPFAAHFQEDWKVGNTTMQFMINEVFREIPDWGDRFRAERIDYSSNPRIKNCFMNNQYILENSWEDALYIDQYLCDRRFEQQEAAMYLTGSWSMQFADQYAQDDKFGIFPYPNSNGDAMLIRETNMTFMKSALTQYPDIVDEILHILYEDTELMEEILDYTQTCSVRTDYHPKFESCLQKDIDKYEESDNVIEATSGNSQLVWSYQLDVAGQELEWLKKNKTLEDVMNYADEHRWESSNNE